MQYLGGKHRIAKDIAEHILAENPTADIVYEPFAGGGGSVTVELASRFPLVMASDVHPDLVMMWQALLQGWEPPREVSEADYQAARKSAPSALRGFIGFGCSFGGKWFGGYARGDASGRARGYDGTSARRVLAQASCMRNVYFTLTPYTRVDPVPGAVIYCDPPYAKTTGYAHRFDNEEFYDVVRAWRWSGHRVYVSEYQAPPDFRLVWERSYTRNMRGAKGASATVCDRLYV